MNLFVLYLAMKLTFAFSGARTALFRITQGELSTEGIRCVLKSLNASYSAFKILDGTGECAILNQSWLANKTYVPGYTYLEKDKALEQNIFFQSFEPPALIGEPNPFAPDSEHMWTLPGTFGVSGRLEMYFTTGPAHWDRFRFFDVPAGSNFDVNDNAFSGVILISIQMSRSKDEVRFKSYSDGWSQVPPWTPFPFNDDRTYKMTIVAQQEGFQILFDDIERALLPYVGSPDILKTMVIRYFVTDGLLFNNVTFYGV